MFTAIIDAPAVPDGVSAHKLLDVKNLCIASVATYPRRNFVRPKSRRSSAVQLDSKEPTELWKWMDTQRKAGNELLAISHNANVSDGWMYPVDIDNTTGRPIDAAWAAARDRNERLIEIKQGKGRSEAHPLLSPNDEFASYEMYEAILGLPANVGRIDHIRAAMPARP